MVGFGILILVAFISLTAPFFQLLENYSDDAQLQKNILIVSTINSGINQTIDNPSLNFSNALEVPNNFSIITSGNEISYEFVIQNIEYRYTFTYSLIFFKISHDTPGYHVLEIFIKSNVIYLEFL